MRIQRHVPRRASQRPANGALHMVVPTAVQATIVNDLNGVRPGLGTSVGWSFQLGATVLGPVTHVAGSVPMSHTLIKPVGTALGLVPWFFVLNGLNFAVGNVVGLVIGGVHVWSVVWGLLGLVEVIL